MKTYSIGRDPECDIVINDATDVISRRHAILNIAPSGKMTIVDQSTNGTYVNGIRISSNVPVPVTRKDTVSFAHVAKMDWGQVPSSGGSGKTFFVILLILLLGAGGGYYFMTQSESKSKSESAEKSESLAVGSFGGDDREGVDREGDDRGGAGSGISDDEIILEKTTIDCPAKGGGDQQLNYKLGTDDTVEVTTDSEWITIKEVNHVHQFIKYSISTNESDTCRTGKIVLAYGDGQSVEVTVNQLGQPVFRLTSDSDVTYAAGSEAGTITFVLNNAIEGVDVKVEVSKSVTWITNIKVENGMVTYNVAPNYSSSTRKANIVVRYGDASFRVTVRQKPGKVSPGGGDKTGDKTDGKTDGKTGENTGEKKEEKQSAYSSAAVGA